MRKTRYIFWEEYASSQLYSLALFFKMNVIISLHSINIIYFIIKILSWLSEMQDDGNWYLRSWLLVGLMLETRQNLLLVLSMRLKRQPPPYMMQQNNHACTWIYGFNTMHTTACHCTLFKVSSIQSTTLQFVSMTHFNITLPLMPRPPKWSPFRVYYAYNFYWNSYPHHLYHMSYPSQPPWFHHFNNVR